ncbi:hypothetical protein OG594_42170 [Streptomyces sp. NBC_01214]|nr:hypothetical protein [Streptomyces sp. NBC_01214]MCX4808125.1 hypothetical protein [Streptomyces sp. NBC_01214]
MTPPGRSAALAATHGFDGRARRAHTGEPLRIGQRGSALARQ